MCGGELTLQRYEKVFMGVPEKKKLFPGMYFLRTVFDLISEHALSSN